MTATTTLAHPTASSIPSSLRTSGHATPNHGSRSNTPMRIKRLVQAHLDNASAPVAHLELDGLEEGRYVRRSSSAHALDALATQQVTNGRRRRLSVTTFGDPEGPASCRDAAASIIGDVLARREMADAAPQPSQVSSASPSSSVLALQMRLGDYAVLGPDASVALAFSQVVDPAVQCVVVAAPGATHVLSREDVQRLSRYCHDPHSDTLGSFLAGSTPAPSLYPTADLAAAAGLLLERPDARFVALVEDTGGGGGGGGFLGLLSRSDLARSMLRDRSCVYEPPPAGSATSPGGAAAAATAAPAAAVAAAGGAATPDAAAAAGGGCGGPQETRDPRPQAQLAAPQVGGAPVPRLPIPPPLPPPQQPLTHRQVVNSARLAASGASAAAATDGAVAAAEAAARRFRFVGSGSSSAAAAEAAAATGEPPLLSHSLSLSDSHSSLLAAAAAPPPPPPQLFVQPPPPPVLSPPALHDASPVKELLRRGSSSSDAHAHVHLGSVGQPPAVTSAEGLGLRSFSDPFRSGWDVLDNVDDALDVLGMVGKTVNAEAVGRKLLADVMGAAANIAGGSSGTGWAFKYLYDGDCSICRTFQAMLEKLDDGAGRVMFVDISSQGFNPFEHGGINYRAAMETIHILSANGQVFKGVTAVIKLLAAVDPEIAANLGVVTAALPLLSLTYMLVSKNRHHLSKVWTQVLRVTKADRKIFGRDLWAPSLEPRQPGQGQGAQGQAAEGAQEAQQPQAQVQVQVASEVPLPVQTQQAVQKQQAVQGPAGWGSAFGSGPVGLAGSSLRAVMGRLQGGGGGGEGGGGGGNGAGGSGVPGGPVAARALRSHQLQTQPSG